MRSFPSAVAGVLALVAPAYAQTCPDFLPIGSTGAGTAIVGNVRALTQWDRNPTQTPDLIAGGDFLARDFGQGDFVARWDGERWVGMGWGTDASVRALTTFTPPGATTPEVIAAGDFTFVGAEATGQVAASHIARWNGVSWQPLGAGVDGRVNALTTWDPDGAGPQRPLLIAGGDFHRAGGLLTGSVAAWDGTAWRALGWGVTGSINVLAVWDADAEGAGTPTLVIAGPLGYGGSGSTGQVTLGTTAEWNGTRWRTLGGSVPPITALAVLRASAARETLYRGSNGGIDEYSTAGWTSITTWPLAVAVLQPFDPDLGGNAGLDLYAGMTFPYPFCMPDTKGGGQNCFWFPTDGYGVLSASFATHAYGYGQGAALWSLDRAHPSLVIGSAAGVFRHALVTAPVVTAPAAVSARAGDRLVLHADAPQANQFSWRFRALNSSYFYEVYEPHFLGGLTDTLAINGFSPADAGTYRCTARNQCGSTSADITVTYNPCGSADFNHDGDVGTDQDIEAFFACLAGRCCTTCDNTDVNSDGDVGTDQDIEAFFRVLAGGNC